MYHVITIPSRHASQVDKWAENQDIITLEVSQLTSGELSVTSFWDGEDFILITDVLRNILEEFPGIEVKVSRKSCLARLI